MIRPLYQEHLIAAVVIPGEEHEDWTRSPTLVVELSAMQGEKGLPLYQLLIHDLTKKQRLVYASCLYDSPHFANTEWAREVGEWIPLEDFCLNCSSLERDNGEG